MNEPKLRFKEFNKKWSEVELKEISERVTRKNKELTSNLPLTISAQYGLIDQKKFFNKNVASKDLSNYILIKHGEFAYNKSYSNGFPFGAIKRLNKYKYGVLSSLYIAFKPKNINSNFLETYYDSSYWNIEIYKMSTEGARNHGLLNISPRDFFSSKIKIPNENEQQKIGSFFEKLNQLIKLQSDKLENLKTTKKGYLQKIFPKKDKKIPLIRFKNFKYNWKKYKLSNYLSEPKKEKANVKSLKDIMTLKLNLKGLVQSSNRETLSLKSTKYYVRHSGQLIYGKQNFFNGSIAIIPDKFEGLATSQDVPSLNIDRINPMYLFDYISKKDFFKYAERFTNGTGSKRLHERDLFSLEIEVPNIDEQKNISDFLNLLNQQITFQQQKLDNLKQQKRAYLQKMFI